MSRRRPHGPTCRHCPRVRLLGLEFRGWRAAWETRLEVEAVGYATEGAEFRREHPAPTFRRYLESMVGAGWPMSGQAPRSRRLA